ncbi:adenosylhomocysteinase [Microbacterium sp. cx-55]|uniref:adenosylhomocysteinase n=1 Tax=Microbacterium sp. cx-55 TaxID=2875948 RepID=UPI001CBE7DCB|nr:adenosylhomocysteinase [Microbacterium sp. cx-55]MBZ4487162.1 adenosylhomocysteinase [Microbacterium sp. cx-55]UGB36762.1 adenosylhomocysteinase [Microbacterium sp. cx-55]
MQTAERIVRRFARRTNLLIAGRPARIRRPLDAGIAPLAAELERMLRALGAVIVTDSAGAGTVEYAFDLLPAGADPVDVPLLLDGAPLPDRGDAAGRIAFAGAHMPVSRRVAAGLDLRGLRVGVAMVLEPKTAQLALLLRAAGAEVAVYAHPDETDADVAAALRADGMPVDADAALSGERERQSALGFLRRGFDVLIDDGSHLIRLAHEVDPAIVDGWIGANEETTSGLTPLRAMERAGALRIPVLAVNDALTKTRFDNRYGTGQSCVFAIADLLDEVGISLRDQPALVIGYGPVGEGVAAQLAAFGAEVRVAETDPVRALVARHDGFVVEPALVAAPDALVVSATGVPETVTVGIRTAARIVAVAGGVPGEVDLAGAELSPVSRLDGAVLRHVERVSPGGALLIDRGGGVNITGAEGNPIEIMDLSFAVQLAALDHLVRTRPPIGVHALPAEIDDVVARAALDARGVAIDLRPDPLAAGSGAPSDWYSPRYDRPGTPDPSGTLDGATTPDPGAPAVRAPATERPA